MSDDTASSSSSSSSREVFLLTLRKAIQEHRLILIRELRKSAVIVSRNDHSSANNDNGSIPFAEVEAKILEISPERTLASLGLRELPSTATVTSVPAEGTGHSMRCGSTRSSNDSTPPPPRSPTAMSGSTATEGTSTRKQHQSNRTAATPPVLTNAAAMSLGIRGGGKGGATFVSIGVNTDATMVTMVAPNREGEPTTTSPTPQGNSRQQPSSKRPSTTTTTTTMTDAEREAEKLMIASSAAISANAQALESFDSMMKVNAEETSAFSPLAQSFRSSLEPPSGAETELRLLRQELQHMRREKADLAARLRNALGGGGPQEDHAKRRSENDDSPSTPLRPMSDIDDEKGTTGGDDESPKMLLRASTLQLSGPPPSAKKTPINQQPSGSLRARISQGFRELRTRLAVIRTGVKNLNGSDLFHNTQAVLNPVFQQHASHVRRLNDRGEFFEKTLMNAQSRLLSLPDDNCYEGYDVQRTTVPPPSSSSSSSSRMGKSASSTSASSSTPPSRGGAKLSAATSTGVATTSPTAPPSSFQRAISLDSRAFVDLSNALVSSLEAKFGKVETFTMKGAKALQNSKHRDEELAKAIQGVEVRLGETESIAVEWECLAVAIALDSVLDTVAVQSSKRLEFISLQKQLSESNDEIKVVSGVSAWYAKPATRQKVSLWRERRYDAVTKLEQLLSQELQHFHMSGPQRQAFRRKVLLLRELAGLNLRLKTENPIPPPPSSSSSHSNSGGGAGGGGSATPRGTSLTTAASSHHHASQNPAQSILFGATTTSTAAGPSASSSMTTRQGVDTSKQQTPLFQVNGERRTTTSQQQQQRSSNVASSSSSTAWASTNNNGGTNETSSSNQRSSVPTRQRHQQRTTTQQQSSTTTRPGTQQQQQQGGGNTPSSQMLPSVRTSTTMKPPGGNQQHQQQQSQQPFTPPISPTNFSSHHNHQGQDNERPVPRPSGHSSRPSALQQQSLPLGGASALPSVASPTPSPTPHGSGGGGGMSHQQHQQKGTNGGMEVR